MKPDQLIQYFAKSEKIGQLTAFSNQSGPGAIFLQGLAGSAPAVISSAVIKQTRKSFLFVLSERESAAYFFNDLENLLGEQDLSYENRSIFLFPASFKKAYEVSKTDNANVLLRSEVINRLASRSTKTIIVAYPEALGEKVVARKTLKKHLVQITKGELLSVDFLLDVLFEYNFERVEFVAEPGEFSLRGGIVDVFSFSNDYPYRIEILGDQVGSLRSFDPSTQLSVKMHEKISILPDIGQFEVELGGRESLLDSMTANTVVWCEDTQLTMEIMKAGLEKAKSLYHTLHNDLKHLKPEALFLDTDTFIEKLNKTRLVEFRKAFLADGNSNKIEFDCSPQPSFNKNFDLLIQNLEYNAAKGIYNMILSDNPMQINRIKSILETIHKSSGREMRFNIDTLLLSLHEGFVDRQTKIACYTDHQIFERYHRFKIRDKFPGKQAMTIREFQNLKPGDYITHIDHGIGIFSGLEKIEVNGKMQEAIRLVYKDNDVLYISIHSLHRISRYSGKEGTVPVLHRLGSNTWANLKKRTKSKVKDIAKDLINLYAQRHAQEGFQFSPDTYLQNELEASFLYEDTPDQEKATMDVKKDMEAPYPMDRLVCGDVGFGKTEIAIRAAFKAVADSKQVAVLVPTTILALQHYYTFSERLDEFPCRVDYISRFRTASAKKKILEDLKHGKIDIIIGTHRLISKDIKFKDLGLLVIDEEQKFGVAAKERLKQMRVNVDTLTLSATPIPRTLQFSMMGARDLSQINTPPPNRFPILTELHVFSEELIRDAVMIEVNRGGQVFFIHNRVQTINEMANFIQRLVPDVKIAIGHGQMEGAKLEKTMIDFISGDYDVLVSTTIVESGLDIPNANTIIINNAHFFGLSDLHQMRGRVGRTNKKAFCYLMTPPLSTLTDEARKRLRTIEEFSELGSGFNIALRDLDIRGAGNLLGAEQSGFIAEIGFETYQKILDEAITELKEQEFKGLFAEDIHQRKYGLGDCQLETDLELMIPSYYVSNTEERLDIYRRLDSIDDPKALEAFAAELIDRFGPLPESTIGLMQAVKLRWAGRNIGFEKIILKNQLFIGYFISRQDSPYFESKAFEGVLQFAQENFKKCRMKESNNRLSITIKSVNNIEQALELADEILMAGEN